MNHVSIEKQTYVDVIKFNTNSRPCYIVSVEKQT